MFSKICILIWFGKVYVCGTSAELSGLPNTKNGSTFHCPSFETVRLHWQDFHPFTHYNSSSKSLEGDLSRYMNTALNACCPRLRIYDEKINITSSCEMEILIRRNHDKNPVIHFPIFSNKGETEQLQRRFVALFHSPGPAVLKFGHGSDPFSNRFLYLLKNVWALVLISFLHALLAGIIIWALEHRTNSAQFPSSSFRGIGQGVWWAFVTMTTVGYGDKAPQSSLARTFAILWMLEGTVLTTVFSARLTADLTAGEIGYDLNLLGKRVGVPLGMETFLIKEFNFGADFEELEDFHELIDSHKYSSLEYLLFFDYDMASDLIKKRRINDLKIEKNIAHEFSVGMSLTGDFGTKEDESFLACWRREIVDDYEIEKATRRHARKAKKKEQASTKQPLDSSTWVIIISVLFVVLGMTAAIVRQYRWLKAQNMVAGRVDSS
ncbi:unnamed protein product [Pocillopora meandrina]|uniref:Potassium channel domain-containing protein n=1 Tax=Pocillopora meandrina TaxID=46732 RepID=A0AAU9Y5G4_9CNID|nr:unnamed protein product [Pocillopora meandrina]